MGILDLILGARNGNDSVLRTFQRFINLDGGPRLMADLFDPLASLTNDRASQLYRVKKKKKRKKKRGGEQGAGKMLNYFRFCD